ncbi:MULTISPECIES: sigma-70 family RNA polymerase sigma factor [Brevibacillus]|jgi:RNA polymerase sigma-70 factor, ECF subfamily|uniref:ECF subfamily RNA polymerase sigma-24 subunit n=2 Tax=Brevibacillus borstelensis TaxID=45462 RepID=M8DEL4_9BACL|nr:sigma-70 family RNA polymerase sigma factor [Brevibacillus borstelensis]EMT51857.1 ECF subfamily RNA polymerase sigma-24 subunit [Brevibacillus borstelensis AK1]MBE5398400.1 sigma-70 family RNA polymerase sigma factor [Brevibacillus borstelensis]MED1872126.1 sigma-70 family RNA polymerase sigma factor [Brevibacillus borstelensis]MED2008276.1 sigma-70 family RNA polymerase sigma factor [Brevibacillus borstelensis]
MNISEENLASELKNRNPIALEYAMNVYGKNVYTLVYRIIGGIGSREDIEECVSDAFITAWKKIAEFDESRGTWKTWLLILAKYKALDYRRKLQERGNGAPLAAEPTSRTDLETVVLSRERSAQIVALIRSFPEPDRRIFIKRYFYYETLENIAAETGLTKKAVENRLFRSRQALRQQMHLLEQEDTYEGKR